MIYKMIADRIINNVSTNFSIDMEYRDIYAYSLERYLSDIFTFIIFSIIAIVFQIPGETIVFAIFYGPLRKYAGGMHVKSRGLCLFLSVGIMLAVIWLSKGLAQITYWRMIAAFLLVIGSILIYKLAPVDSPRRRLSAQTKLLYRKRVRWIAGIEGILLFLGIFTLDTWGSFVILGVLAVLLEGIFLIPTQMDS